MPRRYLIDQWRTIDISWTTSIQLAVASNLPYNPWLPKYQNQEDFPQYTTMPNKNIAIAVMGGFMAGQAFLNLFSPENKDVTDPKDLKYNRLSVTFPLDGHNVTIQVNGDIDSDYKSEMFCYRQAHHVFENSKIDRFHWILYFHSVASNVNPTDLKRTLAPFAIKCFTDKTSLSNLIICTVHWNRVAPIKGQRIEVMLNQYLGDLVNQGARIEHMKTGAERSIGPATEFLRTILRSDPGEAENIPMPPKRDGDDDYDDDDGDDGNEEDD